MTKEEIEKQVKNFAISYWRKRNRVGDNFSILDLINFTTDFVTEIATEEATKELQALIEEQGSNIATMSKSLIERDKQIEKMKRYIKACWVEENLNDYSSYITNCSDEFRDLVKELNNEVRNGR